MVILPAGEAGKADFPAGCQVFSRKLTVTLLPAGRLWVADPAGQMQTPIN